jgi:hypothetical protein
MGHDEFVIAAGVPGAESPARCLQNLPEVTEFRISATGD